MSTSTSKDVLPLVLLVALLVALALSISSAGPASASPGGLTPHDSIHVEGDDDFTPANGVTSGSGTADDPFIIENWAIDASSADGIRIKNTTKYFVIRNCLVNSIWDYFGIYLDSVVNGKVENNICRYLDSGIYLDSSSYINLTNNTCENNISGIRLYSSSHNTLDSNTCENNISFGIWLEYSSDNNTISNNTCGNNHHGIVLGASSNDNLTGNTCDNNLYNFGVYGSDISQFDHNIDNSNLVNGKPIYYLKDNSDLVIDSSWDAGYLGLVNCDNITVENLVLENNDTGVLLASTENSRIENCVFSNNSLGVLLTISSNNTISNNTCRINSCGIYLGSSSYNNLTNNTCENNGAGIWLWDSSYNNLTNNTCENNSYHGIHLMESSNYNTISNNTCENNDTGIYLSVSFNNTIFHNYLLNNTEHNAYDDNTNYWDEDGEGNYWSDWQPPDHPDADGDGIVDEPRPIAGGTNQDDYPLVLGMEVEEAPEIPYMLYAGVISISIIIAAGIVIYRRH